MGGIVALTIRFEEGREWRGSCWTNVLPHGLFVPEFFASDADVSRRHVEKWIAAIDEHRAAEPEVAEVWGWHKLLAPVEYGLVVVDFVSRTLISHQGYTDPVNRFAYSESSAREKPAAFQAVGARVAAARVPGRSGKIVFLVESAWRVDNDDEAGPRTLAAVRALGLALSTDELAAWQTWLAERA